MNKPFLAVALLAVALAGCVQRPVTPPEPPPPPPPPPVVTEKPPVTAVYQPALWSEMPGWPGEQLVAGWPAWLQSCKRLGRRAEWQPVCESAAMIPADDAAAQQVFFESRFTPWRIETSEGEQTGLITGYYEALLTGSLSPAPGRVPLYAVPDDLLIVDLATLYPELKGQRVRGRLDGRTVKPYWNRADIAAGQLNGKGRVLAWADSAMDAFVLEIQGSGRLQLEDGTLLRLGYADQNGHPYRAIGKWLVEQGELKREEVTMQRIRAWAEAHPERLQELLNANPSVVFFRVLENAGGPIGAFNLPLTDGASIAVDPKFIPLGSPVFLATTRPDNEQPLQRLVHAQDTGGAIRGPVRADYFWGFGHEAAELAGLTKQTGRLWLLWPNDVPLPPGK